MVMMKQVGTSMAAKYPKALSGIIGVIEQEKKAIEDVSDVTNIALAACLKVNVNLSYGLLSNALIWKVVSQKS